MKSKTKHSKVSIFIFFIFITFAQASNPVSAWVNFNCPGGVSFSGDSSFGGISADVNLAYNRHLFKISYSYATDFLDFNLPPLFLSSTTISYGYIISIGRFVINPNFAIGVAHYIARGNIIPDTASGEWFSSENYEKNEGTDLIIKIPLYFQYRFSNWFWGGIYIEPFFVGPISGIAGAWVFSFGKMWTDH